MSRTANNVKRNLTIWVRFWRIETTHSKEHVQHATDGSLDYGVVDEAEPHSCGQRLLRVRQQLVRGFDSEIAAFEVLISTSNQAICCALC